MYFSEPLTHFRSHLYTDDGQGIGVDFNVYTATWHLRVDPGLSRDTLRVLVRYLHDQFYRGEPAWLDDWLRVVDSVQLDRPQRLTLRSRFAADTGLTFDNASAASTSGIVECSPPNTR